MIDLTLILAAGVATGTVLLFAAIGELFAERAGVLNLGVEGMMLVGAVAGFSVAASTGDPWVGLVVAMLAGGLLSVVHAVITIHFRAEQVISGLALTFLGSGLARVLGDGLSNAGPIQTLPRLTIPVLSQVPILGPILFRDQSVLTYVGFVLVPLAWYWIARTRPGLHLRAIGERPAAADAQGIDVVKLRYVYVLVGGLLAGLAGATITLAISPGWFGDQTVAGRGWIAIGLVIFAQWSPVRVAFGAYLFGAIFRFVVDIQGVETIFGLENPFQAGRSATFFLDMLPYAFVIIVVILGSREALRRRLGAPAALGLPYVRGERSASGALVLADLETEQLHLDVVRRVELELTRRERRGVLGPRADRRELDDDPLVALDQRIDEQLVGAGLELEVLERVDVQGDRERREVGRDVGRRRSTIRSTQPGAVRDDLTAAQVAVRDGLLEERAEQVEHVGRGS